MSVYWKSRLVWVGVGLIVGGSAPLVLIIAAANLGLTRDPNPNPVGPGLLAFVTFWPGVICLVAGLISARRAGRSGKRNQ